MPNYVALLRGINVGGKRVIRMADLRSLCEGCELSDVATYLQSGNVVFNASKRTGPALEKLLARAIHARFEMDVAVIVRTVREVARVEAGNPFARETKENPSKVAVMFLASKPTAAQIRRFETPHSGDDAFRIIGREVYLHYPNGSARSRLNNTLFERRLGTHGTARNFKTVEAIHRLMGN